MKICSRLQLDILILQLQMFVVGLRAEIVV